MYIIGTAGHIDHGKTTLIKALTNINTMHLPEEKARGITVDLGFANFELKNGKKIGVIDVPGHERFIRNMVAGVWSLDLALLVVSAKEGWMSMTTEHAKVLNCMQIPKVLLIINKISLVSLDELKQISKATFQQAKEFLPNISQPILVDSVNNSGIENLKTIIINNLNTNDTKQQGDLIYWIDRSFKKKGIGTVTTGSFIGNSLAKTDNLIAYPTKKSIVVRGIQAYQNDVTEVKIKSRVAINFKNEIPLKRGDLITHSNNKDILQANRFLIKLTKIFTQINKNKELEIAYGTYNDIVKIIPIKSSNYAFVETISTTNNEKLWVNKKNPFILISKGGKQILATGLFIMADDKTKQNITYNMVSKIIQKGQEFNQIVAKFYLDKYLTASTFKQDNNLAKEKVVILGKYAIQENYYNDILTKTLTTIKQKNLTKAEIKSSFALFNNNEDLLNEFLHSLIKNHDISFNNNLYIKTKLKLSSSELAILNFINKQGFTGLDLTIHKNIQPNILKKLVQLNLLINLEKKIYLSNKIYLELEQKLLENLNIGDKISISQARDKTGLSRKYIIPLFNRMEQHKLLRREENNRIVLKTQT